jgi:xylulokinase
VLRAIARQVDPGRLAAVAIANQRETFVPLDRAGKALRPAILWLDERCKGEVDPFAQKIGRKNIHRITGKPVDYAPVVYRLAWMKKHEPALYRRIGLICDVHAYLVLMLTGSRATSWASADPLGLLDLRNKKWSPVILDALKLDVGTLPQAFQPGLVIGTLGAAACAATGLSPRTAVVAGGGDGQCAGLGAGILSSKRAYLNLGTAVVAGVYGIRYRVSSAFRTMGGWSANEYYYECSLRAGTFSLDWFVGNVLGIGSAKRTGAYKQLEKEASAVPAGSAGVMYLPYLCGVMNPYWDIDARGAFVGLASSHHRGHLYRAILEGIAFEQAVTLHEVEKATGENIRELVAIGGGASSHLWRSILSDVTGKPVYTIKSTEASALGAAICAAMGAGWYRSFRTAASRMTSLYRRIQPDRRNHKIYHDLTSRYRTLYPALRE